jgi:hypothetical protein
VRGNDTLTQTGVDKIVEYAHQGLPIIFSGGIPSNVSGFNPGLASSAAATLSNLTSLENVHNVPYDNLASTLMSLNITPRTAVSTNGTWYTYWREDNETSTVYNFIYNDATGMTTGNISFETTGIPFLYDAWTGDVTPIYSYQQSETHTTVPIQLAGNQSTIIGFNMQLNSTLHIVESSATFTSVTNGASDSFTILRTFDREPQSIALSNGKSTTLEPMLESPFVLNNWTLTVESWTPPTNSFDLESPPTRTNTTHNIESLVPWSQISPTLADVSGLGYYSTSFDWPPTDSIPSVENMTSVSGAFIDLGAIIHTVRVSVNGQPLPPLDLTWAKSDIGSLLHSGINTVEVIVSTPLGNALRNLWDATFTSGKVATASMPDPPPVADYGLVGEVTITPYRNDMISE